MLKIFNPAPQTFPCETGLQFRQSVCSLSCWSLSSAWCFFTF
jgi:hypothetical protein